MMMMKMFQNNFAWFDAVISSVQKKISKPRN